MNNFTKAWRHFKTITKHKWYVFRACCEFGIPFRGLVHDLSKYSPIEFMPSAKHFQGTSSPIDAEKAQNGYSIAWAHHKGHNPHHWEYWTDWDKNGNLYAMKIPKKYVLEMVCDWVGAGKAYNPNKWTQNEPLSYYYKVKDTRVFNKYTQIFIEDILKNIAEMGVKETGRIYR